MVFPRVKFLNLMVIFAAPRACFMTLNEMTLCGSLSISTVSPFLISLVSMETWRDERGRKAGCRRTINALTVDARKRQRGNRKYMAQEISWRTAFLKLVIRTDI